MAPGDDHQRGLRLAANAEAVGLVRCDDQDGADDRGNDRTAEHGGPFPNSRILD
jgi:hypothetical protein